MRGCGMPHHFSRSWWRIVTILHNESIVIAALTSFSGRWVVASATRIALDANIITGRGACVRAARYSVWPVKGTPESAITLL